MPIRGSPNDARHFPSTGGRDQSELLVAIILCARSGKGLSCGPPPSAAIHRPVGTPSPKDAN